MLEQFGELPSWAGSGGGGAPVAGPDGGADLSGVQVVVDQAVDEDSLDAGSDLPYAQIWRGSQQ